jgi:hypothetical protein
MSLAESLPADLLAALAEGTARGEYSLLLGAGASIGGVAGGRPLPGGNTLASELLADFGVQDTNPPMPLPLAYESVQSRRSVDNETVLLYLKRRFTGCVPPQWLEQLPTFTWKRIWTLNIDDTVEQAYHKSKAHRHDLQVLTWVDSHTDPNPNEVQLLHLHGLADRPESIVFSILEYFEATTARHAWHRIFADHYREKPLIILGASLHSEFDLAQIVRRGSGSLHLSGRPSVFVAPELLPSQRDFVARFGLTYVDATADQFMIELTPLVRAQEAALKATLAEKGVPLPWEAQRFLEQFTHLRLENRRPQNYRDLYHGYDPCWFDILIEKDAVFAPAKAVVSAVRTLRAAGKPSQRLELIHGPWGTGKSTAILRVARELIKDGMDAYLFRAESTVDAEATTWWLNRRPNTVLIFDGVADFVPEIAVLLEACKAAGISAFVVGCERHHRIRNILAAIPSSRLDHSGPRYMRYLIASDITELLKTLSNYNRLGKITRWDERDQRLYFERDARRHLFTGMAGLEEGPGFADRLRLEFRREDLVGPYRDLLGMCAFAYEFGYPVPLGIATNATGLTLLEIEQSVDGGYLSEWIDMDRRGLRVRHRRIAYVIVEELLSGEDRFRLSQSLARSIAPHVSVSAIYDRTLPYLIARNILDSAAVRRWTGKRALEWYAEIEESYGWNARYWEQRALAHLRESDYSTARSYAERALGIHKDPYTRTTLAYVMLKQIRNSTESGGSLNRDEFRSAVDLLDEVRRLSRVPDEYPYSVFFGETQGILRALRGSGQDAREVEGAFELWLSEAGESPLVAVEDFAQRLTRVRREYSRYKASGEAADPR